MIVELTIKNEAGQAITSGPTCFHFDYQLNLISNLLPNRDETTDDTQPTSIVMNGMVGLATVITIVAGITNNNLQPSPVIIA